MKRNLSTEGLVLKNTRFGEIHKGVVFLSPEYGLMDAVAYGAYSPKGKLRSVTNPLCAGTIYLYRDPVKDTHKITDMDCREFFEGIRAGIKKYYTACVFLETVLKTFGGDAAETYDLIMRTLRTLSAAPESRSDAVLVQFLWRYLEHAGSAPRIDECSQCGKDRGAGEAYYFRSGGHGLVCGECAGHGADDLALALPPGALEYLRYSLGLPVEKAAAVDLDAASLAALKKAVLRIIQELAGAPLLSVRSGEGIL